MACGDFAHTLGKHGADDAHLHLPAIANAGADREILRGYFTQLSALATLNPQGHKLTYHWQQLDGEVVYLSNASDPTPVFLAPLAEQVLEFQLTVSDGAYRTRDVIRLVVKQTPSANAPRALTGPDRNLGALDVLYPSETDVLSVIPSTAVHSWAPVNVEPARGSTPAVIPAVFRLEAEHEGLRSAPDYLFLWPHDGQISGQQAPSAKLEAPSIVQPGDTFVLDGTGSSDPNKDTLRWHWEQIRGSPILGGTLTHRRLEVAAPLRPHDLLIRMRVHDGRLFSAAVDFTIVVASPDEGVIPYVDPISKAKTHPNNTFWLDALGGGLVADTSLDIEYTWEQTYGPALMPSMQELEVANHFLTFVAPADPAEIAFAVFASRPELESNVAVSRIVVVAPEDNLPPALFVCPTTTALTANQNILVSAYALDPEADILLPMKWTLTVPETTVSTTSEHDAGMDEEATLEPSGASLRVLDEPTAAPLQQPSCPAPPTMLPAQAKHQMLGTVELSFDDSYVDQHDSALLHVEACDALGECAASTVLLVQ